MGLHLAIRWLDATLYQGLPYALVALSLVFTLHYLRFPDLTCASTFVLGEFTSAVVLVQWGFSPTLALLLAACSGGLGGALTAIIHLGLRIDKLVAGILSAFAIYSCNILLLRQSSVSFNNHRTALSYWESLDDAWSQTGVGPIHPGSIVYLLIVVCGVKIALDLFLASQAGLCLRAIEDNVGGENVLARIGVRPGALVALGLVIANALVGLAGALVAMAEGSASLSRGMDVLITGFLAFLIGLQIRRWTAYASASQSSLFLNSRLSITAAAILGALAYFGVINIAYMLAFPPAWSRLALALIVAIAIGDKRQLAAAFQSAMPRVKAAFAVKETSLGQRFALKVQNISFSYCMESDARVLQSVNFELYPGTLTALEGGNGTGKSTLLEILAGLKQPQTGQIWLNDDEVTDKPGARRAAVTLVRQDARVNLVATMSIAENLAVAQITDVRIGALLRRSTRGAHAAKASGPQLDGAFNWKQPSVRGPLELSGGQRQTLHLSIVLASGNGPNVVLCDEPFNNMDLPNVQACIDLLRRIKDRGCAVLVVSHSYRDQLQPDAVLKMNGGRVDSGALRGATGSI
jgi:putative tryptophan/tyrosine transport system permease protein